MSTVAVFLENRPFFGALLVHVPLLHALRHRHPGARIVLLAPFPQAELLVRLGCADEAREYEHGIGAVRGHLRALRPETILALRPASQWLDLAVGTSGAATRLGFRSPLARLLHTRTVPHDTSVYRARKYLTMILDREAALAAPLDEWFRAEARRSGGAATPRARTLAVLPGGGAGAFKLWGIERFLALCEHLAARDGSLRFAFVLGPQEAALRAPVLASAIAGRAELLMDRPVAELAAAAFGAIGAVGNDCGPGHVFQMCGCPFACVMSDHDGQARARIAEWIDTPNLPHAVASEPGRAIDTVPVDHVARAVQEMLDRTAAPGPPALS